MSNKNKCQGYVHKVKVSEQEENLYLWCYIFTKIFFPEENIIINPKPRGS